MERDRLSPTKAAHLIEQLEAEVTALAGTGTAIAVIDRLRHRTETRDGQVVHLTGTLGANREPLVEGDVVQINDEGPCLVLVYGSYTDTSAHFGGIGWHFVYQDGKYAGLQHSSPAEWYIEGLIRKGHIPPLRPNGAPPLAIRDGRYELAPGLLEGTRVAWPLQYSSTPREGVLCFGFYSGRGYGARDASGIVWYVKFEDGHCEPVQYVAEITLMP